MGTEQLARGSADDSGLDSQQAGPTLVRMLLGARLRRLREAKGISRKDARAVIQGSHSKICRLELGRSGFKQQDVGKLLILYGVCDEAERADLLALARRANRPGWLRAYSDVLPTGVETRLELEQAAAVIRCYDVQHIPRLLQTNDYARAATRLDHADASIHEVERRVGLVMRRQRILHRPEPVKLWVILDEAALRRRLGSAATMRHQLEHLGEITLLRHVTIQVMPFSTGVAAGGSITLLRFPEHELTDVVYLDQSTGPLRPDKPADIIHYGQVLDRLSVRAEPPAATTAILHKLRKEI